MPSITDWNIHNLLRWINQIFHKEVNTELIRCVEWRQYVEIDFLKVHVYLRGYSEIFLPCQSIISFVSLSLERHFFEKGGINSMKRQLKSTQEKIDEIVRRVVNQFHPEKIILFGSHAKGTAGPDSGRNETCCQDCTSSPK